MIETVVGNQSHDFSVIHQSLLRYCEGKTQHSPPSELTEL